MSNYILSGESTADLTVDEFKSRDIDYICYHYTIGNEEHIDDFGQSLSLDTFYKRMAEGEITKTSQIGLNDYMVFFEKFLKEGKDILHLTLSSGISGTYNSASTAADILKEQYPDRKIYIVDSLCASSGFGLLMARLGDLRKQGVGIDELRAYAEDYKLHLIHWFFSTDLKYYVRGGRVSKTAGFLGNLLNICPLLNVDQEGKLIPREKVRTVKKVENALVDKMEAYCNNGLDYDEECFISHSDCLNYAMEVKDKIEERFPNLKGKVKIFPIGAIVGCHSGPGTVALFFWGKKRTN